MLARGAIGAPRAESPHRAYGGAGWRFSQPDTMLCTPTGPEVRAASPVSHTPPSAESCASRGEFRGACGRRQRVSSVAAPARIASQRLVRRSSQPTMPLASAGTQHADAAGQSPKREAMAEERPEGDMTVPLFIGNIAAHTTERAIEELFARNGFATVRILLPRLAGGAPRTRRYAFVYLRTASEALCALVRLDRAELDGRSLVLHVAGSPGADHERPTQPQVEYRRPHRRSGSGSVS